jgi:protease PrsW
VAWLFAVIGYQAAEAMGVPDVMFNERPWTAVYCFLLIGPLEEGAKMLLACAIIFRWRAFDEPLDGFVYASALSLGFASVENFYKLPNLHWPEQLARTAALPITHILFSAPWGFGIGYARCCLPHSRRRVVWQAGFVALGMFLHGLYDFLLFAYQATFVCSGMALVLWLSVIWSAGKLPSHPAAANATLVTHCPQGASACVPQERANGR